MALPVPGADRRGLVEFRLFGFPVSIHASFLVIVLAVGLIGVDATVTSALTWLVVVTVSVIVHELGHAVVAAPVGGEPRIDLYGMAGLTRWKPDRASRGRRVAVSLAGPGFGLVLGIAARGVQVALGDGTSPLLADALGKAVYANVAWGMVNLLPMLPLDGGQVVYALMPGREEETRLKRTAVISLVVAGAIAVLVFVAWEPILAAVVVFFAAGNVQTLVALRRSERGDPLLDRIRLAEQAVIAGRPEEALRALPHPEVVPPNVLLPVAMIRAFALLRAGREREAQDTLLALPPGTRLEPVFEATVLLANGHGHLASERLATALRESPPEWAVRELAALLIRREEPLGLLDDVRGDGAGGVMVALYHAGRHAEAAEWGERALTTGSASPVIAYDTACAWARAGDPDRALRALDDAAQLGWRDVTTADEDEDLAAVRALPAYAAVRSRIAENAGLGEQYAPR